MAASVAEFSTAPYEYASVATLAETPVEVPHEPYRVEGNWAKEFSHFTTLYAAMRMVRYSWWATWAVLAEYILPRRYKWLVVASYFNRGNYINQQIVDSTGTLAMQVCAAGMVEGLMPTTRPWLQIKVGIPGREATGEAKAWLEDTEQKFYTVVGQSNFYNCVAQVAQDEVTFGTSPMLVYEDAETVVRCYVPCAGEYYLAVGSTFEVDTLVREFTLNVQQIVQMFRLENCPAKIQQLWKTAGASLVQEFVVMHIIEPNYPLSGLDGREVEVIKGPFPYREVYWLKGEQGDRPMSKRGFYEKPFGVARWSTVSNDPYGRGPGLDALGDIKQLQQETRRKGEFIDKGVRPPMGADPSLKNEPSSIRPGDITYITTGDGKKGMWPLFEVKPEMLRPMVDDIKEVQIRIQRCFLVDVFMAITNMEGVQPRNDLEIAERKAEKLQRLGPVIGLWKSEFANTVVQRVLNIMNRRGLLSPVPKSLKGVPLKFEYVDMVTLAQLGAQSAGMERTMAVLGKLSAGALGAQLPDPLRVLNMEQTARTYAELVRFPQKALYTPDQVAQMDADKAKQAQAQKALAVSQAAVEGAKTLGDTDTGGGMSALARMLGTGGQPTQ